MHYYTYDSVSFSTQCGCNSHVNNIRVGIFAWYMYIHVQCNYTCTIMHVSHDSSSTHSISGCVVHSEP